MAPQLNKHIQSGHIQQSFLSILIAKAAMVQGLQADGLTVKSALAEVERQIGQACRGNLITGEGVTKSGGED